MRDSVSFRFRSHEGNRYEVFEEFAAGGVATLHLARRTTSAGDSRIVAVKRLHEHHAKDPGLRAALIDEAKLVARVDHPNVVKVLDICDDADDLFIAMEYVHGVSLASLMKLAGQPVAPAWASAIIGDALHGLHAAHEATGEDGRPLALVHRDVSPQNIIVGVDGVARVIDFGLAYALGRAQSTQSGIVKGKPSYMSPEQVRGERVTRASDVFSAGIVLWSTLTGKKLFEGAGIEATMNEVLTGSIRSPADVAPGVPKALADAAMRALERSPSARFETARAMADAIEAACPRAERTEIAEWVARIAADDLAEMDLRLAEARSTAPPDGREEREERNLGSTHESPLLANASRSRWTPPRWLGTAVLVIAAGAIGWCAATMSASSKNGAGAERADAATADDHANADDDLATAGEDPTTVGSSRTAANASATAGARPPRRRTPRSAPASSSHRAKGCLDPYDPRCK